MVDVDPSPKSQDQWLIAESWLELSEKWTVIGVPPPAKSFVKFATGQVWAVPLV